MSGYIFPTGASVEWSVSKLRSPYEGRGERDARYARNASLGAAGVGAGSFVGGLRSHHRTRMSSFAAGKDVPRPSRGQRLAVIGGGRGVALGTAGVLGAEGTRRVLRRKRHKQEWARRNEGVTKRAQRDPREEPREKDARLLRNIGLGLIPVGAGAAGGSLLRYRRQVNRALKFGTELPEWAGKYRILGEGGGFVAGSGIGTAAGAEASRLMYRQDRRASEKNPQRQRLFKY